MLNSAHPLQIQSFNWKEWMQKNSILSQRQLQQILEKYIFGESSLEEIVDRKIEDNCNLNGEAIINRISLIVRKFLLELQKSIWIIEKIKELKIYDHDSEGLFKKITLNLKEIISDCKSQFMHLYKNTTLNSIEIIWQTEYTFVHSDKKMKIYESIIRFCEKKDLFAVALEKPDPLLKNLPYQSVEDLFPTRDLELILKKFKQTNDVIMTYEDLKKLQIDGPEYKTEMDFVARFDNLLLIGVYSIHKLICLEANRQSDSWRTFKQRSFSRVNFESDLQMLLRVAIRNDPSPEQIQSIRMKIMKKEFNRTPKATGAYNREQKQIEAEGKGRPQMSQKALLSDSRIRTRTYYEQN